MVNCCAIELLKSLRSWIVVSHPQLLSATPARQFPTRLIPVVCSWPNLSLSESSLATHRKDCFLLFYLYFRLVSNKLRNSPFSLFFVVILDATVVNIDVFVVINIVRVIGIDLSSSSTFIQSVCTLSSPISSLTSLSLLLVWRSTVPLEFSSLEWQF